MRQAPKRRKRVASGAVLVELALILPALALLFATVIDLGLLVRDHQLVQNAAREGARFSILPENCIECAEDPAAAEAAIRQAVVRYLTQSRLTITPASITIDQNFQITAGEITVDASRVTVTCSRQRLILPGGPVTLTGEAVFRNLY
jgi:Flp pilus assembly protein TadG